jgi:hypothetical protein
MNMDYIRIIALWASVFALVIFAYQLGQSNMASVISQIHTYCPGNVNYSVGIFGSTSLWNGSVTYLPMP